MTQMMVKGGGASEPVMLRSASLISTTSVAGLCWSDRRGCSYDQASPSRISVTGQRATPADMTAMRSRALAFTGR